MSVIVAVKVTPRSSRNEIRGWTDSSPRELSVHVTAAPADGKANKAVCELVASSLSIAKGRVKVLRGQTSRHKQLEVDVSGEELAEWSSRL